MTSALLLLIAACSPKTTGHLRHPPDDTATNDTGGGGTDGSTDGSTGTDTGTGAGTGTTADSGTVDTAAPLGVDVSRWDGTVDWSAAAADGISFAYVKATEGTYYNSSTFTAQYDGSYAAGMFRGAYHFANPRDSAGADQADFFVDGGGGWSADGHTLPGALDIEYDPYTADECYGLSTGEMTTWIGDFLTEYEARTGRDAVIYSTADWWDTCTDSTAYASASPMWVADYGSGSPAMPHGWTIYTFWQYTSTGSIAGIDADADVDVFNGSRARLRALALGK